MLRRRRLLGAGAGALQHHGAALDPALGGRAGRWRSTRPRPSAAWRSAAGSGAASPRRTARPRRCSSPRRRCSRPARSGCGCRCRRGPSSTSTRSNRWTEPEVGVDLTPRSGPIMITIEYLIDEPTTSRSSSTLMAERQRIRRRDGARALDAAARPRGPAALGRELPDPDLGRVHPPQPAPHQGRRRLGRPPARAAPRRGAAARAAPHRPPGHPLRRRPHPRRRSITPEGARPQRTTTLAPMGTRS